MSVDAQDVKALRERTGAGILDCKEALQETGGDLSEAEEWLREQGIRQAAGKNATAAEGRVAAYVHTGASIGVLVEVNCETDFVANTDAFQTLVDELAMQIAASAPSYVRREEVPRDVLESEKERVRDQFEDEDKPDDVLQDIVQGKLEKEFFQQEVLMDQPYIRDEDQTVEEFVNATAAELDETVRVRRFERYEVGEGLETDGEDFAEEVAREIG